MPEPPLYSDSGCTGTAPLVLGTARGVRTFYLDENGWMRGITYRHAWRDGENVARCYVTRRMHPLVNTTRAFLAYRAGPYVMGGVVFDDDPNVEPVPEAGHEFASCSGLEAACGCGFYAYHNSGAYYAINGPGCRMVAVVEAYGKVVLGTSGFRAEKARILGVVLPPSTEASKSRLAMERAIGDLKDAAAEYLARAKRPWWRQPRVLMYGGLAAACAAWSILAGTPAGGLLVAGYLAACARITYKVDRARATSFAASLEQEINEAVLAVSALPEDFTEHVERARKNYPGVQFFESKEDLLHAFPVESLAELAREKKEEAKQGE